MKNIPIRLRLRETSLNNDQGIIYSSVEIEYPCGYSIDISLRAGHHPNATPAQRKRYLAEARAYAWETAAATLQRLATQAERKARRIRATSPNTWEDTRDNCS